jgi:hypothetical protein
MRRPPRLHALDVTGSFEVVFVLRLAPPALLAFAFARGAALRFYAVPLVPPITCIGHVKLSTLQTLALVVGIHPHPPQAPRPVQPSPRYGVAAGRKSTQTGRIDFIWKSEKKTRKKIPPPSALYQLALLGTFQVARHTLTATMQLKGKLLSVGQSIRWSVLTSTRSVLAALKSGQWGQCAPPYTEWNGLMVVTAGLSLAEDEGTVDRSQFAV